MKKLNRVRLGTDQAHVLKLEACQSGSLANKRSDSPGRIPTGDPKLSAGTLAKQLASHLETIDLNSRMASSGSHCVVWSRAWK
jgi:hypothetical protein